MSMFSSVDWVANPCTDENRYPMGLRLQEIVFAQDFWRRAERITYLLEPLVKVLKLMDGYKHPTLPYVYDGIDKGKLAISARSEEKIYGEYYKRFWKIMDNIWNN